MVDHEATSASTTEGLPVAPSLGPALEAAHIGGRRTPVDSRTLFISAAAIAVALAAGVVAQILVRLIGLITNLAFYGRVSTTFASPAGNHLGPYVVLVPVAGAVLVGLMARYGSAAIRGHGIPEAMERVLKHQSRIPPRLTFLKPLSAAISIGTGGPFGAEGPIIATGGALGSLVGQLLRTTPNERKTLLAAGAAAGMAATFGSPVSAVLLAIELLLFELSARTVIPVALACAAAAGVRIALVGAAPVFPMPSPAATTLGSLTAYVVVGAVVGLASVYVTRAVYAVEDAFEKLPVHWMWWPAIGALAVGIVGYFAPHTMGVGYDNIEHIVSGELAGRAMVFLCLLKFVSWVISLGSGTSGGTLAPLFTIGGGMGATLGAGIAAILPMLGVEPRVAGLVGMAAIFAGSSRALLASVVFAFETTRQPMGLLPLLGGCTAAYLVSCLRMQHTIMTEKIERRGVVVPAEYGPDALATVLLREAASLHVVALAADDRIDDVRTWITTGETGTAHQGWPVTDGDGRLLGVVTRRDLANTKLAADRPVRELIVRAPLSLREDASVREAVELMGREKIGRLPVLSATPPYRVVGIVTRSDLLAVVDRQKAEAHTAETSLPLRIVRFGRRAPG